MKEYFTAELRLLQEAAQEFAQQYPEQARQLKLTASQDQDPYIERLLEGTAFLTAQIRQRIDDDLPDICETLLQQICPALLRPLPALTILQFTPRPGQLQHTYILPKQTPVQSQAILIEGSNYSIPFRTTYEGKINPLKITQQKLEQTQNGSVLRFILQGDANINLSQLDLSDLKFFIHADADQALMLCLALMTTVEKIKISDSVQVGKNIGGQELIQPCHFSATENLIPGPLQNYSGFQLLQEYFIFPEKHLFFLLNGLGEISLQGQQLLFEIYFNQDWTKHIRVDRPIFQLNCVPAINLMTSSSEPIKQNLQRGEYLIKPSIQANVSDIYSVDWVTGITDNSGQTIEYAPMTRQQRRNQPAYFHAYTRKTGKNKTNTLLVTGGVSSWQKQTISCAITVYHDQLPRMLISENMINCAAQEFPNYLKIKNLMRPTAMISSPEREDYRWQLISFLSLNYQGLMNVNTWQDLLQLFNWTKRQENQRKITGLESVSITVTPKIERGIMYQNLIFKISLREDHFHTLGDLYLFGSILHHFLQTYVPLNLALTTQIFCLPSGREFSWYFQSGANSLI